MNSDKGWICPRCGAVNAPWKGKCSCAGPTKQPDPYPFPPPYDPDQFKPWRVPKKWPLWLDENPYITWSVGSGGYTSPLDIDNFF